jgi:hypothetical protein
MRYVGLPLSLIVLCTLAAFAQDQRATSDPNLGTALQTSPLASTNPEPWRIIPKAAQQDGRPEVPIGNDNLLNAGGTPQVVPFATHSPEITIRVLSSDEVAQSTSGNVCYSIRSYLMARDSKDSDSTHSVGMSTCQPAKKYALKTTGPAPHIAQP